jgi:RNA polymerase sigma factor (sigma-70 family)
LSLERSSGGVSQSEFLALVDHLRPELHRYCARLTGSIIDGEDVLQDALANAFATMKTKEAPDLMRAWLFRIAHNRALDLLRSRASRQAAPLEAAAEIADAETPDPLDALIQQEAIETAISRFVELPTAQRSVIILKDILGHSLEDIAALLEITVNVVKAHLARGRARLKIMNAEALPQPPKRPTSAAVARYVTLFNSHDWDALRAMLADDIRLSQSMRPPRAGTAEVDQFFSFYAHYEPVRLVPAWLEGREVIAVFESGPRPKPSYFMWLEWRDGRITFIRDYRYVRYVVESAELMLADHPHPSGGVID